MNQYRYNPLSDRWIILADSRKKRPHRFTPAPPAEPFVQDCPFCPSHEKMTPPETFALRPDASAPDTPGWQVRVVPNKYPALTPDADPPTAGRHTQPGLGVHEVIIESPQHDHSFADHSPAHAAQLLGVLRDRYRTHAQNSHLRLICIFNNHGRHSGASLPHPHFQLIAPAVLPISHAHRLTHYQNYYSQHNRSIFDAVLEEELTAGDRIIATNEHFVAFCPYGSRCPFEAYIVPRQNDPDFAAASDDVLASLAQLLQPALARLKEGLGDPDYNLALHTAPLNEDCTDTFRWFLEIYPRLATRGGFEIGTHMYINTTAPETAAAFYRNETNL